MNDSKFLEFARERVGGSSPYAFAFGMVWTSLTEAQRKELTEYAEQKLAEIKAEKAGN
jgi:hypothetical protein